MSSHNGTHSPGNCWLRAIQFQSCPSSLALQTLSVTNFRVWSDVPVFRALYMLWKTLVAANRSISVRSSQPATIAGHVKSPNSSAGLFRYPMISSAIFKAVQSLSAELPAGCSKRYSMSRAAVRYASAWARSRSADISETPLGKPHCQDSIRERRSFALQVIDGPSG